MEACYVAKHPAMKMLDQHVLNSDVLPLVAVLAAPVSARV